LQPAMVSANAPAATNCLIVFMPIGCVLHH
jgi:hypothetical protein